MRTIVFHGDADNIVNPSNATDLVQSRAGESIERARARQAGTHGDTRTVTRDQNGAVMLSSGSSTESAMLGPAAAQTALQGPDASKEMVRFFLEEQPVLPVLDD